MTTRKAVAAAVRTDDGCGRAREEAAKMFAEQIEELRSQLYHAEQTVRAGRQAVANIHDALLRGEDDATLLRMMTEAYGPKVGCGDTVHNV
jgi:hypothetical protein